MEYIIDYIMERYNLTLISYTREQKVCNCITNEGIKELKESKYCKEKIYQDYKIRKYLKETDSMINTSQYEIDKTTSLPYVEIGNRVYTLEEYIEGKDCNFDKQEDVRESIRNLANLHKELKGLELGALLSDIKSPQETPDSETTYTYNRNLGNTLNFYKKRKDGMQRLLKKVKSKIDKDAFDFRYQDSINEFIEDAELAIRIIENSKYEQLVADAIKEKTICHNNYAYDNVIITKDKKIYVLGFENANYDLRMYDLANIIKRRMRKSNWNIEEAKKIINDYDSISRISYEELEVLYAMLVFPQKFWRIINQHYTSRIIFSLESDLINLEKEIEAEEFHKEFIQEYKDEYLKKNMR